MKFQKIHLFIILLLALIFCSCLGSFMREGMENIGETNQTKKQEGDMVLENATEESILNEYAMGQYPSSSPTTASSKTVNGNSYEEVYGKNATVVSGPNGKTVHVSNGTSNGTSNVNDQGVPRSSIPPGQEDLYILKSEIVPPVCPACPQQSACPRQEKCPPCPACARCPEPAFECKKVPNYSSSNDQYLPRPVLADFSQFGM